MIYNIIEKPFATLSIEWLNNIKQTKLSKKQKGIILDNIADFVLEGKDPTLTDKQSKVLWKKFLKENPTKQVDGYTLKILEYQKEKRDKPTRAEAEAKKFLLTNEIRFAFQKIITGKSGKCYIVDFYLPNQNLIFEVDGASHIGREVEDAARTADLEAVGFKVVRATNEDVFNEKYPKEIISIKNNRK